MAKLICSGKTLDGTESNYLYICSECGVVFIPTEETTNCPECEVEFDEGEC